MYKSHKVLYLVFSNITMATSTCWDKVMNFLFPCPFFPTIYDNIKTKNPLRLTYHQTTPDISKSFSYDRVDEIVEPLLEICIDTNKLRNRRNSKSSKKIEVLLT